MTELEKAAMQELNSSYAVVVGGELTYQRQAMLNMFNRGAQWQSKQSPWISVKVQLPEESLINPSAWSVTYKVFILTSNRNASISQRKWNSNINKWEWKGSGSFKDSIVAWMPIPDI